MASLEAMAMGAVDFVAKPGGTVSHNLADIRGDLVRKVRAARRAKLGRARRSRRPASLRPSPRPRAPTAAPSRSRRKTVGRGLVVIGVSTGGPTTLQRVLSGLPADLPVPVAVAQHMPASFTSVYAERLDRHSAVRVVEVNSAEPLQPGTVYIAQGDADMVLTRRLGRFVLETVPSEPSHPWHPSVTRLVSSAAELMPAESLLAVQLTGMGDDGAEAMARLRRAGGHTIAESEESAVIYGMPRALVELDGASEVLHHDRIAAAMTHWASGVGSHGRRGRGAR